MVLKPEKEEEAKAIFRKWGLDFAVIGHTTDTLRFVIRLNGEVKADLPIKELGDEAPLYDRPHVPSPKLPAIDPEEIVPPVSSREALLTLIATPDLSSKRWVYEQYDSFILGNTVQRPGGDAAVVRIERGPKGLALTCDVTPRYCEADPVEGGRQAVAETYRNLCAVGATPKAITDNLNFGNPERPEIMGQLVGCIRGIGEACRALDFPVVSGNVSLYNETNGRAILPTPTIGGVGVIDDVAKTVSIAPRAAGEQVFVVGRTDGWLGQSLWLRDICGREEGAPPPVDLTVERLNGEFVRAAIAEGLVAACHDVSDGGLLVALADMVVASGMGLTVDSVPRDIPSHAFWFGEDQGRYVITVAADNVETLATRAAGAGTMLTRLGTTGGDALTVPGEEPILAKDLSAAFESWLPAYMARAA